MALQDIDSSFQFGEDPPWANDPPEIDRGKANAELESGQRILHTTSGLYCEHGIGPYKKETHIFLSKEDNVPMQICKSALEVAAFLGGYSRAVREYLPIIIAAVSLTPKDGPAYKLLNDHIYRNKSCYSVTQEPELEQDKLKINETCRRSSDNLAGACGIFDGENPTEAYDNLIFNTWTCRFCGGTFANIDLALKHAIDCDDNEDVHSCNTCRHNRVILGDQEEVIVTCELLKTRGEFIKHCISWTQKKGL